MNQQEKQTKTHRHRQQYGGYQKEVGWGLVKGKESQIYGTQGLILAGGCTHNAICR